MKPLFEAGFHLIFIDIIGMGSSSRPEFNEDQTSEEADAYFVQFLENWRKAFGDIKDFYLAGHSFGGYICGNYALKYPQYIKKLLMLSPAGVCQKPPTFNIDNYKGKIVSLAKTAWKNKWSPFGILRKSGSLIARKMIKKYLTRRMRDGLTDEERDHMLEYMQQILLREGSTEYAIFICFEVGLWALNPLEGENRLGSPEFALPVSFFYGDSDWMDYKGGQRIVDKSPY
jgi:pimeloyl-ACP methyl ester carboxylesterase